MTSFKLRSALSRSTNSSIYISNGKGLSCLKVHPLRCALFRNENRKSGPKSEVSVWRLELFQWKLKSILAGNFGVSISSFEFSFPGLKEHSYLVFQTSAQSFEVRGARMNRFDYKWLSPICLDDSAKGGLTQFRELLPWSLARKDFKRL